MHQQYGPIIRISPWEVHINDPDWNDIYRVSSKVNKYNWYYRFVGSSSAGFGTADYELHRVRRRAQQAHFTLESVAQFDTTLHQFVTKLSSRLENVKGTSHGKQADSSGSKPNIIQRMLDSPDLSQADKAAWRIALEARTFFGAGTETMGNTLSVTTFHLLTKPTKMQRLKEEVRLAEKHAKRALRYQDLQQLPYLTAVISEGLRISTSVAGRLPRVNTRETMHYKAHTIPAGTPVSMSQKLTHDNPNIFPSPREFIPERWLDPLERKRLEKYLRPFGRGSRSCLGIHLAYAELYMTLAELFGRFDMELFDTGREEIEQVHDFFSPFPSSKKGLRVLAE